MKIQPGQTVLLTGASGGLGVYIARALFGLGLKMALVAHPGAGLEKLRQEAKLAGVESLILTTDLRDPQQCRQLIDDVKAKFGAVDILINNAGVEFTSEYHDLTEAAIREVIAVNLAAPMMLTRWVLPGMLERGRGHIVSTSSLAGKSGPAFQEPYSATKAGLIAFTFSLRATYRDRGVSASAIVPGFVEAGMYTKLKQKSGCSAPALLGTSSPDAVVRAVLRAIENDLPEIIVNTVPIRPLLAFNALFPRAGEWIANKSGANEFFRKAAQAQSHRPG